LVGSRHIKNIHLGILKHLLQSGMCPSGRILIRELLPDLLGKIGSRYNRQSETPVAVAVNFRDLSKTDLSDFEIMRSVI
jgi:hypothetical protein